MKTEPINRTIFLNVWLLLIVLHSHNSFAQENVIKLTFTAIDIAGHIQLDSIKIMNRTQGGDTVLFWPDTVLSLNYYGITEINNTQEAFQVFQNYPNPVANRTTISLFVPEMDHVSLHVTEPTGCVIFKSDRILNKGVHTYEFTPGPGNLYFFTAKWRESSSNIKILSSGFSLNRICALEYTGTEISSPSLKVAKDIQSLPFNPGDKLLYIGYTGTLQSGMLDSPVESAIDTFQFSTNIPCPGTPTVDYEGQVYNTIQIFSQCWLKENLNVGEMINGTIGQSNNGTMEKYCYNNEPDSCKKYGGMYQWNEMMQYTTQQGAQGICPPGWHLPTDEEWQVLQGAVDSEFGIGDVAWHFDGFSGFDAGTNLKTTSGWIENGNGTNLFGFSGLPGGNRTFKGDFGGVGEISNLWTSTQGPEDSGWYRYIVDYLQQVGRHNAEKENGKNVRCLQDSKTY
jgi:uncharacterized protein (TIGR02145 family)